MSTTTLSEPKSTIYAKLNEISMITVEGESRNVDVFQERPDEIVLNDLLMITYRVNFNAPRYDLDKEIRKQDIQIKIDLWGLTSKETGALLVAVEEKMRELDYLLVDNLDVPDPKGYSHITTQFNF